MIGEKTRSQIKEDENRAETQRIIAVAAAITTGTMISFLVMHLLFG